MQIFAKRQKTATTPFGSVVQWKNKETASAKKDDAPSSASKNNNTSDAFVTDLLKKDPSEWSSKEKPMVKQHQDCKKGSGKEAGDDIGVNNDKSNSAPIQTPPKSGAVSVMHTREKATAPELEL